MKIKSNTNPVNAEQPIQEKPATDQPIEHYCIFYNALLDVVNRMTQLNHVKFLNYICQHLTVANKGTVYLTIGFKEQAAKEIGCSERTIDRAIDNLKKLHILIVLQESERSKLYQINPLLIWKGDLETRLSTISALGLKPNTISTLKRESKTKAKRNRVKRVEIDFDVSIKKRLLPVRDIIKELQKKFNYPEPLCKKFYEYYTQKTAETEDGQKIMEFERIELEENRAFNWAYKLNYWNKTERPDKLSRKKEEKKEKEPDRKLKPWEKPGFNTDLLFSKDLTELEEEGY